MRVLGLDPGLQKTGWGIVDSDGTRLSHVANGTVKSDPKKALSDRLLELYEGLECVIAEWQPHTCAVEETFVNKNPASTLKLGQARGICLLVPARAGLIVAEYTPNHIKKSVVGVGHAAKDQVDAMIRVLLPGVKINGADAADALAVSVCHAHHVGTSARMKGML
ncbi:crossover junction endodeoxyribonuclease RuvC [Kordiimonas sediminis]|uniref:Crossover junction endodeoxyribonuclease RuvC n=1 Tax=Kordiimonas sediminis TaxID=1735581 RepID=A0A919ASE9_9PROT|nr:crossover junction endodeoxyribonuclease RuvC [Kordiimonas sediminis]GHF22449.1 crossover junction endodeoxyribonuclease RuvC [Kordiimonas sediminis]